MKKTNPRNKQIIQILLIALITIVSVLLFLYPEALRLDYKYSYKAISENKAQIEEKNQSLSLKELEITNQIEELENLSHRRETLSHEKSSIGLTPQELKLDIPSFLITLEQKAFSNNLKFKVIYEMKNLVEGDLGNSTEESSEEKEESEGSKEESGKEEVNSDSIAESKETEGKEVPQIQSTEDSNSSVSFAEIEKMKSNVENIEKDLVSKLQAFLQNRESPSIDGIQITEIPIVITGSFAETRNYLKYLDEIGMIEPASFNMISHGSNVSSSVLLQIFHEEE